MIRWFVYIGKNPRFTAFSDSNLHTRLAIVTENELGLAFPPRNLPKNFRQDPSTFHLVIVVTNKQTDRQTDRQTNAGDHIISRESFLGDKNSISYRIVARSLSLYTTTIETLSVLVPVVDGIWGLRTPGNSSYGEHLRFSYSQRLRNLLCNRLQLSTHH